MREKPSVYLAGRMDHDVNKGHEWRDDMQPFLENLGFTVLNPYLFEPRQLMGLRPGRLPKEYKHWTQLRHSPNKDHQDRFVRYMRRIIKYDLDVIKNEVDIVVVKWDEGCRDGAGTHSELTLAWDLNIPVYCIEEYPMPNWARGCCEKVFKTIDEIKLFINEEYGQDSPQILNKND